jgi:hypothetical protein
MRKILSVLLLLLLINSSVSFGQFRIPYGGKLLSSFDSNIELQELREYIIKNIYNLDVEKASGTVYKYILLMRHEKPELEKEINSYLENKNIRIDISKITGENLDMITDRDLKLKLNEIIQDGYYICEKENKLFLQIDYGKLSGYSYYLDNELNNYIEIFSNECIRPSWECGSFSISEYEFASRLIEEYEFYRSSMKYCDGELKSLINSRLNMLNKGLSNYPLTNKDGYLNEYYYNVYMALGTSNQSGELRNFGSDVLYLLNINNRKYDEKIDAVYKEIYLK